MTTNLRRSTRLIAAIAPVLAALASRPAAAQRSGADRAAWMAGCWQRVAGRTVIEEHWMPPAGGVMLGMSRTTRGDTLVEFEFSRIVSRGDTLVLVPQPQGRPPTEFRAVVPVAGGAERRDVTFENPHHDFPQRIRYRRIGADSLVARIEGERGGRTRGIDFLYRRAPCASGP